MNNEWMSRREMPAWCSACGLAAIGMTAVSEGYINEYRRLVLEKNREAAAMGEDLNFAENHFILQRRFGRSGQQF